MVFTKKITDVDIIKSVGDFVKPQLFNVVK